METHWYSIPDEHCVGCWLTELNRCGNPKCDCHPIEDIPHTYIIIAVPNTGRVEIDCAPCDKTIMRGEPHTTTLSKRAMDDAIAKHEAKTRVAKIVDDARNTYLRPPTHVRQKPETTQM